MNLDPCVTPTLVTCCLLVGSANDGVFTELRHQKLGSSFEVTAWGQGRETKEISCYQSNYSSSDLPKSSLIICLPGDTAVCTGEYDPTITHEKHRHLPPLIIISLFPQPLADTYAELELVLELHDLHILLLCSSITVWPAVNHCFSRICASKWLGKHICLVVKVADHRNSLLQSKTCYRHIKAIGLIQM